jgi:hypothetical protein
MRASSPAHGLTPSQRARINIEAVGQGLAVRNLSKSIEFKWFYSVSIAFCRRDKGLLKLLPATYQMLAHPSEDRQVFYPQRRRRKDRRTYICNLSWYHLLL